MLAGFLKLTRKNDRKDGKVYIFLLLMMMKGQSHCSSCRWTGAAALSLGRRSSRPARAFCAKRYANFSSSAVESEGRARHLRAEDRTESSARLRA